VKEKSRKRQNRLQCVKETHTQREIVRETNERQWERNMYTYMHREERV
jgi:hypothetical protein